MTTSLQNRKPVAPRLILLGLAFGLLYGTVEAALAFGLSMVPEVLSWRYANSYPVFLVGPLFYGVAFAVVGAIFALLSLVLRRLPWALILVVLLAGGSGYLLASTPGRGISIWTRVILGLGAAAVAYRAMRRAPTEANPRLVRSLPLIAATTVGLGLLVVGGARVVEWWRVSRLAEAKSGAPNVLLLIMDTERADHLSTYGYERPTTPNLTRLADEGALFLRAYSPSPWTLPSHATMLTGIAPRVHRAGEERISSLDDRFVSVAEVLSDRGYRTGGFIANIYWAGRQTGLNQGFQRYEDYYGSLGDAAARTVLGRTFAYDILPKYGFIDIPGRKRAGEVNADFLDWLGGANDRPFFAMLNYMDVHAPYLAPAPFRHRYSGRGRETRSIEIGAFDDNPKTTPEELQYLRDTYDESLAYLDAEIGALADSLAARGQLDNTIVIVTSDHGEAFGEHGFMFHGRTLYMDQIHVPLIMRFPPGLAAGLRVGRPVGLLDLPATVLELAAITDGAMPGASLLGEGATATPARAEVAFRPGNPRISQAARGWVQSAIGQRWKLIEFQKNEPELYDVPNDPAELTNLAERPELADTLAALSRFLADTVSRSQRSGSSARQPR